MRAKLLLTLIIFAAILRLPYIDITFLKALTLVSGILAVLGSIFLTRQLFPKRENLDLWVGLSVAVNPWGVWLSKGESWEMVGFSLLIWGVFFIFKKKFRFLSGILLLLMIGVTLIWLPIGANSSLLLDQGPLSNVNTLRGQNLSVGAPLISNLFFNKSYYLIKILENFLSHFNLSYLFAKGDGNPLHGPKSFGPLLLVFLPFFTSGLISMIKEKPKNFYLLILWTCISTIPSLFLTTGVATNRFLPALYPLSVVIAWKMTKLRKPWLYLTLTFLAINFSIVAYNAYT